MKTRKPQGKAKEKDKEQGTKEKTFNQRRHTDGQQTYENMLTITNQQGNTT